MESGHSRFVFFWLYYVIGKPGRCLSPPKVCNKQMIRAVCIRLHCKIHREIQSFLKIKGTYSDVLQRYFKYLGPFIFREGVFNMT